jgi:exoribonuclease R
LLQTVLGCDPRLFTIYFPEDKITMLPVGAITSFSLLARGARSDLSLYLDVDATRTEIAASWRLAARLRYCISLLRI